MGQVESVWLPVFQELRGAWGELYYKLKECKGHPRAASRAEGEGRAAGSLALGMESGGPEQTCTDLQTELRGIGLPCIQILGLPITLSEVGHVPYYIVPVLKAHFTSCILKPLKFRHAWQLVESYSDNYQRLLFPLVVVPKIMTCLTSKGILGLITCGSTSDLCICEIETLKSALVFTARDK